MSKEKLKCWCKMCGKRLKTKREYIKQEDTCDECFLKKPTPPQSENISTPRPDSFSTRLPQILQQARAETLRSVIEELLAIPKMPSELLVKIIDRLKEKFNIKL